MITGTLVGIAGIILLLCLIPMCFGWKDSKKEVENIRKKYLPKEEDKLETLRRLDRSAELSL